MPAREAQILASEAKMSAKDAQISGREAQISARETQISAREARTFGLSKEMSRFPASDLRISATDGRLWRKLKILSKINPFWSGFPRPKMGPESPEAKTGSKFLFFLFWTTFEGG